MSEKYLTTTPGTRVMVTGTMRPNAGDKCDVNWGSHGCMKKKHHRRNRHNCFCCHGHPRWLHWFHAYPRGSCVARYPYYGADTRFYGSDIGYYGLGSADATTRPSTEDRA